MKDFEERFNEHYVSDYDTHRLIARSTTEANIRIHGATEAQVLDTFKTYFDDENYHEVLITDAQGNMLNIIKDE